MMVVLAGRYCVIPLDIESQEFLVADRMATLQTCTVGRKRMEVEYVAEPVLGECFAYFMTKHFDKVMNSLCQLIAMKNKVSLAGNTHALYGEMIAVIVMTRVYDVKHSLYARHFSQPVMVQDILSSFISGGGGGGCGSVVDIMEESCNSRPRKAAKVEEVKDSSSSMMIRRSLVRYLQFTRLTRMPTPATLEAGFRRCAAFLTLPDTIVCNLVIPILLGEENKCEPLFIIHNIHTFFFTTVQNC